MITSNYPVATFEDVLSRADRTIEVEESTTYRCLGVRLYGAGAFEREEKLGMAIRRKTQSLVRTGDVLYNKLFAWKGTFAVAGDGLDGCIASDKFPIYEPKGNVEADYLRFWFMTDELAAEARHLSKGAAALSKLTLNPPDFWKMPIPLPPLEEQRRVVGRIQRMMALLDDVAVERAPLDAVVQGRRAGVGSQARLLMSAALRKLADRFDGELGVFDEVLTMRPRSGPSFACSEDGVGARVLMPSALGGYRLDSSKVLFGDGSEHLSEKDILQPGDLIISRGNKRDQVGLCVVYKGTEKTTYANLLMRMQVDRTRVAPEFVKYWLMSPAAIRHIRRNTKGTSPSVQKINQSALVATPFPTRASLPEQDRWIQRLDHILAEVDDIEELTRRQHADVLATRKSVLSAGFRGEL